MKHYTVDCSKVDIGITDEYHCAFRIGARSVVVKGDCSECPIYLMKRKSPQLLDLRRKDILLPWGVSND